jgi:hypothetical protein
MPKLVTIPPALADLGFTIEVPDGFAQGEIPREDVDFDNPTLSAPLAIFSSQVALALIAVAARPAYETGSVLQWTRYLCDHFGIALTSVKSGTTSGSPAHPAIIAQGEQEQNGQQLRMVVVALEDGGRLVTAHAMCPAELWPSFGEQIARAVQSITLSSPKGPKYELDSTTAPGWAKVSPAEQDRAREKYMSELEARRKPAEERAAALIAQEKFDEAELEVQRADSSIYGGVALSRLYEARLKALVEAGEVRKHKDRVEKVYRRALSWAQNCYPEAHTEVEAEDYEKGREQDRARLVKVLGYEPK